MSFRPSSYHDEKVIILVALEQGILSLQCVFVSSNCAAYVGTHTEFHFSSDRKNEQGRLAFGMASSHPTTEIITLHACTILSWGCSTKCETFACFPYIFLLLFTEINTDREYQLTVGKSHEPRIGATAVVVVVFVSSKLYACMHLPNQAIIKICVEEFILFLVCF